MYWAAAGRLHTVSPTTKFVPTQVLRALKRKGCTRREAHSVNRCSVAVSIWWAPFVKSVPLCSISDSDLSNKWSGTDLAPFTRIGTHTGSRTLWYGGLVHMQCARTMSMTVELYTECAFRRVAAAEQDRWHWNGTGVFLAPRHTTLQTGTRGVLVH